MTDLFQSPPPVGDNSAAVPPAELVIDEVTRALARLEARRDELNASARRVEVVDNDTVARAADLRSMIEVLKEEAWDAGSKIAAPYGQAVAVAKNRTERWLTDLTTASAGIQARIDEFRTGQRLKIRQQQEEQAEIERQLRAAAPEMPEPTNPPEPVQQVEEIALPSVRGDYGSQVGDRMVNKFTWTDVRALPDDVLNHPKVAEAIEQACRDIIKIRKTIEGVTITKVAKTQHRKPR